MSFQLRNANEADIDLILHYILELADHHERKNKVTTTKNSLKEHLFSEDPKAFVTIIEFNGNAIGAAFYYYKFSAFIGAQVMHLELLFLEKKYRNKGFGKKILAYLAQKAIDTGCNRLEWMVSDCNTPTVEFYKSIGAESLNEWTVQRITGKGLKKLAENNS